MRNSSATATHSARNTVRGEARPADEESDAGEVELELGGVPWLGYADRIEQRADQLVAQLGPLCERARRIGEPVFGADACHRVFGMTVATEPRLEQVGAEGRGDHFAERRRLLAGCGESVQDDDSPLGARVACGQANALLGARDKHGLRKDWQLGGRVVFESRRGRHPQTDAEQRDEQGDPAFIQG